MINKESIMVNFQKQKSGVVIGKFMPLHLGHKNLILFAAQFVETLYVLVDNLKPEYETFSLSDRVMIIQNEFKDFPNIIVKPIPIVTFQDPSEDENFWNFWRDIIKDNTSSDLELIVGSEAYVQKLGEVLNINYLIYDLERINLNISATKIRNMLSNNNISIKDKNEFFKKYLPKSTIEYFQLNICILGTECVGKTTIVKHLSNKNSIGSIFEYAKTYIDYLNRPIQEDDFKYFVLGHLNKMKINLNDNFFNLIDNSIFVSMAYYNFMFNKELDIPNNIIEFEKSKIKKYVLLNIVEYYEKDTHRLSLSFEERLKVQNLIKMYLNKYNVSYSVVNGSLEERTHIIESLFRS